VIYPPPMVTPTVTTPKGIKVDVDLVKWSIDLRRLDERFFAIDTCVKRAMAEVPNPTAEQRAAWGCGRGAWDTGPIKLGNCIQIKVVDPETSKCHPEWQFLPGAPAPSVLCEAKGLTVTATCPCRYRAGVIDDYKLVTPPALYLWPLVNVLTKCTNPWGTEKQPSPFAKCMGKGLGY
jgi:hypothetical protein